MKINYLRRAAGLLTLALAVTLASSCSKDDDEDDDENIEDPKKAFFEEKLPMPEISHEAVDLGLPSGTKWASMNIGAASESEIGLYFAWGETVGFGTSPADGRPFFLGDYKWNDATAGYNLWYGFTKYQIADGADGSNEQTNPASNWYVDGNFVGDNKTKLDDADDAAILLWGDGWRMPTKVDIKELCDNCTSVWDTVAGVIGKRMTSKLNGNSIFLPAGGDRGQQDRHWVGEQGYYWSSTLKYDVTADGVGASTGFAYMLFFTAENHENPKNSYEETEPHLHYARRFGGRLIRPVK